MAEYSTLERARQTPGGSQYAEYSAAISGTGLSEILGTIRRRIAVLFGCIGVSLVLGIIVLTQLTPLYTAESMVLIESEDSNLASIESMVAGLPADAASIQSQAYVLNSRNLAHRVVDRLGLFDDPEFNSALASESPDALRGLTSETALTVEEMRRYHDVADKFSSRLTVSPQANSRVIAVSFVSESPEKAQQITNTLLDEYILSKIESKYESTKRANTWLSERIEELRESVETTESEIEQLRVKYGLIERDGLALSSQEYSEINSMLITSRSRRAEAEAQFRELSRLIESPNGVSMASELVDSPLIERLREQQAEIERDIAELSSEYGARHPRMVKLSAEANDIDAKIAAEVYKEIAGLENEVSIARAKERSLEKSLGRLKGEVAETNQNSIEVRMLEREAEANRALLATLLGRQKETLSQEDFDFQQADARIISYADLPVDPSFPNKLAIIALVFIGSTFLGLFGILLLELLDKGVHSGEELTLQTGLQSLGFAPTSAALNAEETLPAYAGIRNSAFGQSMKTLNWSVRLGYPDDEPPQTIMITSSVPREGKSTIAACMAYSLALSGSKVLLIDADLRRPSLHKKTEMDRSPGLLAFLKGKTGFDGVVKQYGDSNLYVIPAGGESNYDSESVVSSDLMDQLLLIASDNFDTIIVDTPPVMACSDARILSKKVDSTVFVVRWNSTRQAVVQLAIDQLVSAGACMAGVFLSMVNVKRYSTYQYGDSAAYSEQMSGYYSGPPEKAQTGGKIVSMMQRSKTG
jgi:capsular exopolysaccharide synthesis family protein